jgi:hypothetical protein
MAAIVKDFMVVHGGLDSKNVFLGDMAVLNLAKHEWKK